MIVWTAPFSRACVWNFFSVCHLLAFKIAWQFDVKSLGIDRVPETFAFLPRPFWLWRLHLRTDLSSSESIQHLETCKARRLADFPRSKKWFINDNKTAVIHSKQFLEWNRVISLQGLIYERCTNSGGGGFSHKVTSNKYFMCAEIKLQTIQNKQHVFTLDSQDILLWINLLCF